MANPEHLAKLKEGVEAWNAWRDENPDVMPDLVETNLSGVTLEWANLFKADLTDATLFEANLFEADLSGANLTGASLLNATLIGAELSGADLTGATLSKADGLDSDQLCSASSLVRTKLDDALKNQAMKQCPEKFKVYGF